MRKIIVSFLLLISFTANSQVSNYNLPPKPFYNKVSITFNDFTKIEGKQVHLSPESISYMNSLTAKYETTSFSKINYLRVQEGNEAIKWSALGALFMGVSAIVNMAEYPTHMGVGKFFGFTMSGALIGGLIGSAIPKHKTYYIKHKTD
jgi:hypothetical protein